MRNVDIEDISRKVTSNFCREFDEPTHDDVFLYKNIVMEIIHRQKQKGNVALGCNELQHIKNDFRCAVKNSYLLKVYDMLVNMEDPDIDLNDENFIVNALRIKRGKSHSGVIVLTVMLSPHPEYTNNNGDRIKSSFSCQYNCLYCPNDPSMPRSYLALEPACLRGLQNNFDPCEQLWSRMNSLKSIGHRVINKIEVIVEGGTWGSFPMEYRDEFVRDIYYALNVFGEPTLRRTRLSLLEEKRINKTAKTRMSGLILETRPDNITVREVLKLREYGCTRVQLGIQHIDQDVLDANKRQCTTEWAKTAIKILKDCCFKIDIHIMPNMFGSSVNKDRNMLIYRLLGTKTSIPYRTEIVGNNSRVGELVEVYDLVEPDLQADHWKLYPNQVVPWSGLKELYEQGIYKPYSEDELIDLLVTTKSLIFPWIRLNRCVRDIPTDYIYSTETGKGNLRNELSDIMRKDGTRCNCIRCKEPKEQHWDGMFVLTTRRFNASDGIEYFISVESRDHITLYGFIRLRFPSSKVNDIFPELNGCSLIRELHCYGTVLAPGSSTVSEHTQHRGIGKLLINRAECLSKEKKYAKIAVIAGEGVKEYYEKRGYHEGPNYMIKYL